MPPAAIRQASKTLSERYRAEAGHAAGEIEALAYLATRLPATFAAVAAALDALSDADPDFAPASLLDLGAGPGTAAWAAAERFPSLREAILVERMAAFRDLGHRLAETSGSALAAARWLGLDIESQSPPGSADLVVLSYVLGELDSNVRQNVVRSAWNSTGGMLLIVEPGTANGARRVGAARDLLLAAGATLAAPCPHPAPCPLASGPDWCHGSVRLARSRAHRAAKSATLGWEDEKFSYLAASRRTVSAAGGRLLFRPRMGKASVTLPLCRADGTALPLDIPARDQARYKPARKLRWGDRIGPEWLEEVP